MVTMNGIVTFYLRDVYPFVVRYEATVEDGEVVDFNEDMEHCSIDIFKNDLEWAYNDTLHEAIQLDVNKQLDYINS